MHISSRYILTLGAIGAGFTLARAQDAAPAASPAECHQCEGFHGAAGGPMSGGLEKLADQLGVTADQKAQIMPIIEAAKAQAMAVFADTTLTEEQKHAKIRETMEAVRGHIEGLLTPDQKQKIEALKAEHLHRFEKS